MNDEMEMPEWCEAEDWCPITLTSEILGRKWHPVIVDRLLKTEMGFNQLQRNVSGVSAKVLNESLEDLQEKGLVEREVIEKQPMKVEYSLTEKGKSLENVINAMKDWGIQISK